MKNWKFLSVMMLCMAVLFSSCGTWNNTAKGTAIGVGGGAAAGAGIGAIAGNTALGAVIGAAVGGTAGALIGKKMDKQKKELEQTLPEEAVVETINDGEALKVTFDSGILFATNKADLSASAKNSLAQFANVLNNNRDCDVTIIGHTDNTGSDAINQPLSVNRANSVSNYLKSCGVQASQIKSVEGQGSTNPVADNSTAAGRQQNRRVEVYMYASQAMIQAAQVQN